MTKFTKDVLNEFAFVVVTFTLLLLVLMAGPGCGRQGEAGAPGAIGAPGLVGASGGNGSNGHDGSNGTNGSNGQDGTNGTNGAPGQDAAGVTVVQLCPGVTTYPTTFSEVAFCISGKLWATYSDHGGFSTELPAGTYSSNGINSSCTFTVGANCEVTH